VVSSVAKEIDRKRNMKRFINQMFDADSARTGYLPEDAIFDIIARMGVSV